MICSKKIRATQWLAQVSGRMLIIIFLSLLSISSFAQKPSGDSSNQLYDDFLDKLVGKWEVDATVHKQKFTLDREAEWVLNHQYICIREKSREVIPWLKTPFERTIFIGYNHLTRKYVVYELTVHGADGPIQPEGFSYAERSGNELRTTVTNGSDMVINQRFTWEPESGTWRFSGRRVVDGKEQEPHVDQRATRVKVSK